MTQSELPQQGNCEEAHLLELLNFISDCMWVADAGENGNLYYTYLSPVVERISGRKVEEFLENPDLWLSCVHPEDSPYVENGYRRLLGGKGTSDRNDYRILLKNGGERWVRENTLIRLDPTSGKSRLYGVITCLTEATRFQEEMARLAAIVEGSDDCILSKSLDGVIQTWNRGAEKMYGYTSSEIIGKPVSILIPTESTEEFENIMSKLKRGETIDHLETIRRKKDGTNFPVSLTISPLKDASGRVVGASTIARDISVQKALQSALEEKSRILQLSNENLEQFAAVASHDLQEPLRTITAFCGLLENRLANRLSDTEREYFALVLDASKRMNSLILELLEYSRIGGQREVKLIAAAELVERAKANLAFEIAAKRAEIHISELPAITVNHSEFTRLFQELIANALKYCHDSPRILVQAMAVGNEWVFSISDNGIGIPSEHHDDIFRIFKRLHAKRDYPGNGIGLASCRKIVEAHGGRIWVEKGQVVGSVFRFAFPLGQNEGFSYLENNRTPTAEYSLRRALCGGDRRHADEQ